jgi:hypothetical protein
MRRYVILCSLAVAFCMVGLASAEVYKAGGERLIATQNGDGGWDWPLRDLNPKVSNAPGILAPTAMGLVQTYRVTGDPNCLEALKKVAAYLLKKSPLAITPEDGYLAAALDEVLAVTTYTEFVKKNFFNPLASGTYDYLGTGALKINTERYIEILRQQRASDGVANLAAFDCGMGLYAAHLVGADTKPWIAATKAEINELSPAGVYDVLGLAGAVLGLASVGETVDPTAGTHAAAGSLADLAGVLAGYQLATGGFTWNALSMKEGANNETRQETAFALLTLKEVNSSLYLDQITSAAAYLKTSQLPTGGWEDYFGQGEYNEVTGEALWAVGAADLIPASQPEDTTVVPTP